MFRLLIISTVNDTEKIFREGFIMQQFQDCPQVLREFLSYHETIKGQSQKTISEYYLDLRMFPYPSKMLI